MGEKTARGAGLQGGGEIHRDLFQNMFRLVDVEIRLFESCYKREELYFELKYPSLKLILIF